MSNVFPINHWRIILEYDVDYAKIIQNVLRLESSGDKALVK